jgi:hypothetical protein
LRRFTLKPILLGAYALAVVLPSAALARAPIVAVAPYAAEALATPPEESAVSPTTPASAEPQADAQTLTITADTTEPAPPATDLTTASLTPPGESPLPAWVQVVGASGSLYAVDSGSDQVLAKLPRHAFLRVIDGGTSRLHVQVYDDSGAPGQTGWVGADQVLPSAPGTGWLVTAKATTLWPAPDAADGAVRNVDRFAPLQRLDGPQLNRIQVRVYRSDFTGVVAQGWVDVADTGPALPPQLRVPGPSDPSLTTRAASTTELQAAFLEAAAQAAREGAALTGVPASVTVAQAILESDWGRSTLAQGANNYFGMKALGTLGDDGVVWMPTSEYTAAGQLYQTTSAFRAYKSLADSTVDHDELLASLSRYAAAMRSASDPKAFAALIAEAGYATDPGYADKLVALMDRYNLYSLDA